MKTPTKSVSTQIQDRNPEGWEANASNGQASPLRELAEDFERDLKDQSQPFRTSRAHSEWRLATLRKITKKHAALVRSVNNAPRLAEASRAVWKAWHAVPFDNDEMTKAVRAQHSIVAEYEKEQQ